MNKKLFEEYLYNPNELPASSIAELKQIITEYPYFQTAHMLYIKSLHSNNSILYAAHLKQTACYANDRTLLFRLMKGKHAAQRPFNVEVDVQTAPVLSAAPERLLIPELAVAGALAVERQMAKKRAEEIPTEALSELVLRRLREIDEEHERKADSREVKRSEELAKGESSAAIVPEQDSLLTKLQHGKFTPHTVEYIHNLEQKIADSDNDFFKSKGDDRVDNMQDKLIDAFLTKQPRIIPQKPTNNEEVEDISTKSVEEPEIMTETIAKIYLNQEQYEKAQKIYETLSLKYPQKSIYFADKISQIKELIKNSKKT